MIQNTILNKDILSVLPDIPDGTFDAVISDPPYKQEAHGRGLASKRAVYKEMAKWTNMDNDWYNEDVLKEYVRICKFPNIFLFCGKRDVYKCLDFAINNKLEYWIIPICKKTPVPFTNNTWLSSEFAVHITDRKLTYTKEYNTKIPYFIVGNKKTTKHPNEKDLDMVKRIINNITPEDGFVFDGFMGSGTTALACKQTNRNYYGCEIDSQYYQSCIDRLNNESKQLYLFEE